MATENDSLSDWKCVNLVIDKNFEKNFDLSQPIQDQIPCNLLMEAHFFPQSG